MIKLSPVQRCALDGLRQHMPHGVPPVRMLQHYAGNFFAAASVNHALNGLARRGLCHSYTQDGARRYQLTDAGEAALREAEDAQK